MVVAQPHAFRYILGRMEAMAILVQLGRGIQHMQSVRLFSILYYLGAKLIG